MKQCSAEDVVCRHTKRLKINQEQVRYLQKGRAQMFSPVMADLPKEQLDAETACAIVEVDYIGTLLEKIGKKNEKRWCSLITCLTIRVVHIKLVPKLETDRCLNAIICANEIYCAKGQTNYNHQ